MQDKFSENAQALIRIIQEPSNPLAKDTLNIVSMLMSSYSGDDAQQMLSAIMSGIRKLTQG